MPKLGYWKQLRDVITPGGTPLWVCGGCGESAHLHGVEYPKRKMICDGCGRVNIYPWEAAYEVGSSLWENDEGAANAKWEKAVKTKNLSAKPRHTTGCNGLEDGGTR